MSLARWMDHSLVVSTLSKLAIMSRKRVETFRRGLWSILISWMRVATASEVLRPGRELHWLGCSRPTFFARTLSLTVIISQRIFEMVLRRTIIQNENRVS